jgi:hypothetical protein
MVTNIVNFLSQAFTSTNQISRNTSVTPVSNNPFANPFVTSNSQDNSFYAKNKPVQGGYFAGYYNGKSNIVGQRLFVEA